MKYAIPLAMVIAGIAASIVFPVTHPAALLGILATTGLALLVSHDMLFKLLRQWFHRDIALAYAAAPMLVIDIINEKVIFGVGGTLFVSGIIYTCGMIITSEVIYKIQNIFYQKQKLNKAKYKIYMHYNIIMLIMKININLKKL